MSSSARLSRPHHRESPSSSLSPMRLRDLPGPRAWPLLGHVPVIDPARAHLQMEQWALRYGPVYRLELGGPVLVVSDHEAIAAMLRDRPDSFERTPRLNQIWLELGFKPGVFGANGDAWRRQRRMVMAGFDPTHVRRYYPSLQVVAGRLATRWRKAAASSDAIDLQRDLMRFTVDAIAGLAFGAEVNTLESDGDVIQQHLDQIFPALGRRVVSFPLWRYWRRPADRRLERSVTEVNRAVDGFVAQARERMRQDPSLATSPRNLLEAMLAAAAAPDSGIDDDQVAGNVLTMLLAGEDTTANSLAWTIDLLWRHPDALQRATDEVRRVVVDASNPTMDQLQQLDFVEACLHEGMRLKPVAPLLPLFASKDSVVAGVQVPAGTVVVPLMRADSMDDAHVAEALAFQPERWLGGSGTAGKAASVHRVSMPFGAGPRICPGRYLALLEMKLAMATLLGHFDIAALDTPDGQPARELLAFTMAPVGLRMRLRVHA